MKRATKGEIAKRTGLIAKMLLEGKSKESIVRFSSEEFCIKERMVEKYIAKAQEIIEKSVVKKVDYDYSKAVLRYEELYRLAFDKKDYKSCLSINKELSNLQGLHKVQVEHSGGVEFISNLPEK